VETSDSERGFTYKQVWRNNMGTRTDPVIKPAGKKAEDFTCVTFKPDLKRFSMEELEDDIVALFEKRAHDIAALTAGKVRVTLNGRRLELKSFGQYVDMYLKTQEHRDLPKITQPPSDRWEVICTTSDGAFG
jgi:DNA topoisomerase-2